MDVVTVIEQLEAAKEPKRSLDGNIAQVLGWQKVYELTSDPKKPRIVWLHPTTNEPTPVPAFTADIQAALDLAKEYSEVGGTSWESGMANASVGHGPIVTSVSPAIAICLALLNHVEVTRWSGATASPDSP